MKNLLALNNLLVLITTFVGYWMGSEGAIDWLRLVQAMLATALCAASAAAFNQLWEVKIDSLMPRTASRPVVTGRVSRGTALGIRTPANLALWAMVKLLEPTAR
jgi:heme O synthase-like polyprenyltransferase